MVSAKAVFDDLFERLLDRRSNQSQTPPQAPTPGPRRRALRFPGSGAATVEFVDAEDQFHRQPATVRDQSEGGLGLAMSVRIAPGWPVLIEYREQLLRGVVRHARQLGDQWHIGLQVVSHEKRRAERFPYHCPVTITWEEDASCRQASGTIVDASEGGVQVAIDGTAPEQSTVCVYANGWRRFGVVSYCRPHESHYRVGVQFSGAAIPDGSSDYKD